MMPRLEVPEYCKNGPVIPMAALVDIVLWTLIVFMTITVSQQLESEVSVNVPKSQRASEDIKSSGEIVISITAAGEFFVNQQSLDLQGLEALLGRVVGLFPDQAVIIRADEKTYHQHVIRALDACARANIWNISFATLPEGTQP
jgi:biopolymer transport protein ExbD